MSQENIDKIKNLLKFYKKQSTKITLVNIENKNLDINGTINELKTFTVIGKPYVIIINDTDPIKVFLEDIDPNSIHPVDTKTKEVDKDIPGRKGIGKSLKFAVWDRYFGDRLRGKCLCCGVQEITRDDCEMCHIISVAEGGETNVNNLKPGCKDCNRSMGTMNFDQYKKEYH